MTSLCLICCQNSLKRVLYWVEGIPAVIVFVASLYCIYYYIYICLCFPREILSRLTGRPTIQSSFILLLLRPRVDFVWFPSSQFSCCQTFIILQTWSHSACYQIFILLIECHKRKRQSNIVNGESFLFLTGWELNEFVNIITRRNWFYRRHNDNDCKQVPVLETFRFNLFIERHLKCV